MIPNEKLPPELERDSHKDERLAIICHGPSLAQVPLEFFGKQTNFGCNSIYLALPEVVPNLYAIEGQSHLKTESEALARKSIVDKVASFNGWSFINRRALHWFEEWDCKNIIGVDYFLPDGRTHAIRDWSYDPLRYHATGRSVTFFMLQAAFWLGFDPVLLVGLDHSYAEDGKTWHAYDDSLDPVSGNVMDPDKLARWGPTADAYYALAADKFDDAGRTLLNLSPVTKTDAFWLDDLENWL